MAKRWLALILGILMAFPLSAWAEGSAAMQIEASPHSARFTYTNSTQRFILVEYKTTGDYGKLVLYSENGAFTGECSLPASFEREPLILTVSTLDGKVLGRYEAATVAVAYPTPAENLPAAERKAATARNLSLTYDGEGVHYSFDAPGHTQLWLRCRSGQEKHELPIYPGENWHFEGTLPMNCTYNDAYLFLRISSANKSSVLYEDDSLDTYLEMPAAAEQAAEGRLKGVTVCIDPGHQRQTQVETVKRAPNMSERVTTRVGSASGMATGRKESIVTLEVGVLLRDLLLAEGATVVMTRDTQKTFVGMLERADIPNNAGADFVLRLHCNSGNQWAKGIQVYYPSDSSYAREVADMDTYRTMGNTLLSAIKTATGQTRGDCTLNNSYVGNNWSKMPSFLVEMGYMTSQEEDYLLSTPVYQQWLAQGMVEGVVQLAQLRGLIDKQ